MLSNAAVLYMLITEFLTFYETQYFLTMLKTARHLSLFSATSIHFVKIHFNIILPSMFRSSKRYHSLRTPKTLLLSYVRARRTTHLIPFDLIT